MKNHILDKLEILFSRDIIRFKDLTDLTDDPGNTQLGIALIPFADCKYNPLNITLLQNEIDKLFDSTGDHHEEVTVQTMNNEYLILFNFNK